MHHPWLDEILACPVCGAEVRREVDAYACTSCQRKFPIRYGIPDFRLAPDPYISIADELRKIDAFQSQGRTYSEMLRQYYALTPESPPELHRHYLASMEAATARGAGLLRKLHGRYPDLPRDRILDLGCGTGGMSIGAAAHYKEVTGIDVALRWLVMGKQRLAEQKVDLPLICANAESLPLRAASFDAVVADAVLEHVDSSIRMRDETLRVLRPGGAFFFTTNNRFSILPEPHVRIFGFGLLPRSFMEPVAKRLRHTPYRAKLHSRRELRRLFKGIGEVTLAYFESAELGDRPEAIVRLWNRLRAIPPIRALLGPVVPQYFIAGQRPSSSRDPVQAPAPRV